MQIKVEKKIVKKCGKNLKNVRQQKVPFRHLRFVVLQIIKVSAVLVIIQFFVAINLIGCGSNESLSIDVISHLMSSSDVITKLLF